MQCPFCGAEIREGSKFCGSCGQQLPEPEPVAQQQYDQPQQQAQQQYDQPQQQAQQQYDQQQYEQQQYQQPTYEPPTNQVVYQQQQAYANAGAAGAAAVPYPRSEGDNTLLMVAFILNIICTVAVGWLLLPLAWMIPMTVVSYGVWKGTRRNTVAFGVCTLIFVSIISGILMLVAQKDEQ